MTAAPNETLRQHVTGTAFLLSLGKTHITALVLLDHGIRAKVNGSIVPTGFSHFIAGARGLRERGLVVHLDPGYIPEERRHLGRYYKLTKAGRLVRDLLKEAGIWQETEATLGLGQALEAAS